MKISKGKIRKKLLITEIGFADVKKGKNAKLKALLNKPKLQFSINNTTLS